jgi:hypothetical protein
MDIKKTKVFSIVLLLIIGMIAVPFSYAQNEKTLDNPSSSSSTTNTNLTVNYLSEKQVKEHYNSTGKLKPPTPVPLDVKTRQYKLVADGNNLYLITLLNNSTTKQLQLSKYDKDTFKETNKINLTYPNLKIDYILHLDAVSFNDTLYVVWQQINGNTSSVYLAENKNDTNKNSFNVFPVTGNNTDAFNPVITGGNAENGVFITWNQIDANIYGKNQANGTSGSSKDVVMLFIYHDP